MKAAVKAQNRPSLSEGSQGKFSNRCAANWGNIVARTWIRSLRHNAGHIFCAVVGAMCWGIGKAFRYFRLEIEIPNSAKCAETGRG